ncbi:MAG: hypothetical protein OXG57_00350 [Acidimicrobiaceae bacterium]|nr:hypothetical protein [Acidimicrobiaceae bacterium]
MEVTGTSGSGAESIREYLTAMNEGIAARFDALEAGMNEGFAAVNSRVDAVNSRVDAVNDRMDNLAVEVAGIKATTDALFDATADNTRKLREID